MGREMFAAQVTNGSISTAQYVTNLYEGFLQRGPDTGGMNWWVGQAGGEITAQNPLNATKRQNVLNGFATASAAQELAGTLYREANWLVSDHLGTPRIVVDKTGALAGVKRHDYLPFGEDVGAGISGRTTVQGYSGNDGVRQRFTEQERDGETGLDYMKARYYSPTQGRFTSVDPENAGADPADPQSWNGYSYVLNNPLAYTDPTGEIWVRSSNGNTIIWFSQERWDNEIRDARDANGNALYTPLTQSEMEFNTVYGRVRLNPDGPDADAEPGSDAYLGFSIVGDNKTNFSVALAAGIAIGAKGRNPLLLLGGATIGTLWILSNPVTQHLPLVDPLIYNENTPATDPDNFEPVRGSSAKKAKDTGEIWVKDRLHKDHYEVYKNKKDYEKGKRDRSVWEDGRPKENF